MSAVTCAKVGTGGEGLKKRTRNEGASKAIARDIVLKMLDDAMEAADNGMKEQSPDQIKDDPVKNKPSPALRGTGDQSSNEVLEDQEPICNNSRVEKKTRLTDLVKNSKQVLAKIISSESKLGIYEGKKQEEKIVEVIDVTDDDVFECTCKWPSENVFLPEQDTDEITKHLSEERMYEVNLDPIKEGSVGNKKAIVVKRKRWDVGGRIADLCRKIKKGNHDGARSKSQQGADQRELKETRVNVGGRSNQICSVL